MKTELTSAKRKKLKEKNWKRVPMRLTIGDLYVATVAFFLGTPAKKSSYYIQ